jgi:hypothetical protein
MTAGTEVRKCMAALGCTNEEANKLTPEQVADTILFFEQIIEKNIAQIKYNWRGFGFVPNINAITFGEFVDLIENCKEFNKNLPKILSILYRPIVSNVGNKYTIEDYDSDKHLANASLFREMPLHFANGAMVFFSTIRKELVTSSLGSLDTELRMKIIQAMKVMSQGVKQ